MRCGKSCPQRKPVGSWPGDRELDAVRLRARGQAPAARGRPSPGALPGRMLDAELATQAKGIRRVSIRIGIASFVAGGGLTLLANAAGAPAPLISS